MWRSAGASGRARVLGAFALAASFACLGFLSGRWSTYVLPTNGEERTAALIEAVSQETREKAAAALPDTNSGPPPVQQTPTPSPPSAPVKVEREPAIDSSAEPAGHASEGDNPTPGERVEHTQKVQPKTPLSSEAAASEPAALTKVPEASRERRPAPSTRGSRKVRHATAEDKPSTASSYQALRDYMLSR